MSRLVTAGRETVALATAACFACSQAAPVVATSQEAAATPAAIAAPPAAAEPRPAVDGGWPREYQTASGGRIVLHQPQIASWQDQRHMAAYSAVSYQASGETKPALGTIKIESDTRVAISERLVNFTPLRITESHFPTLQKEHLREVVAEIDKAIPDDDQVIALDRVLASLERSQILPKNVEGVKADAPAIFYSVRPAVLVNLDGEAIWSPIRDNELKFAVNTNWDLFQHGPTQTLYLRVESAWLKAPKLEGPWTPAGQLPASFSALPADENWKDVKAALPGSTLAAKDVPSVFVSTRPAELILVDGGPVYEPVAGTRLVWVSNTESDLFRMGEKGAVYYLVSGRWFSAPDFTGPWTFATPSLPDDFKKISLEHPRSRVLASVPGSQQAAESVALAQVPQTARVNRKELKAPEVDYQGEPKFVPVEPTSVSYAANTDKDVLKVGDLYYMCFQGVWFMSKSPTGPWEVTSSVPKVIYEIPASSPVYNVTYVTVVEEDTDDEWVTFAAVAAYTGVMIAWGCAVWGTGWYYPPYWGWGAYYPYYYPRYPTYGYGAWYNPWTGGYGRSAVAYGPYGGAGVTARYNPRTGTYARGAAAWGPYGARGYGQAYNPRTGAYGQTRQGSSIYGSWGSTSVQRGDQWARTARVTNNATGNTTRVTQGSGGGTAVTRRGPGADSAAVRTGSGDVYAGRDGNVYRRQEGGGWQKYDNGSWSNLERPQPTSGAAGTNAAGARDRAQSAGVSDRAQSAGVGDRAQSSAAARDRAAGAGSRPSGGRPDSATMDQLNRDSRARSEGAQRTRDYSNYQRSGDGSSGASSYRGGSSSRSGGSRGGGSRGGSRGGGRRR
jgi:hypothetical protein